MLRIVKKTNCPFHFSRDGRVSDVNSSAQSSLTETMNQPQHAGPVRNICQVFDTLYTRWQR